MVTKTLMNHAHEHDHTTINSLINMYSKLVSFYLQFYFVNTCLQILVCVSFDQCINIIIHQTKINWLRSALNIEKGYENSMNHAREHYTNTTIPQIIHRSILLAISKLD